MNKRRIIHWGMTLLTGLMLTGCAGYYGGYRSNGVTPDVNSGHEIFSYSSLPCIELPLIDSRG